MEVQHRTTAAQVSERLCLLHLGVVVLVLGISTQVFASVIKVNQARQMIHDKAGVYEDPSGKLDYDSILRLPESRFKTNKFGSSFGFSSSAYWFQFDFENAAEVPAKRLLVFETSWMNSIELYGPVDEGRPSMRELGDHRPYRMRTRASPSFIFDLELPPGESTYCARVVSHQALMLPISLWSPLEFEFRERKMAAYFGAIYGAVALMFLYNFLVYISVRDRRYIFYCLYLLSFFLMNFAYNGFSFAFLWPNSPGFANMSYALFIYGFQISGLLFAMAFLETKERFPYLHRFLRGLILLECVVACITWLSGLELLYNQLAVMLIFVYAPTVFTAGFYAWRRGFRAARLFVLASTATLIGSFVTALTVSGFIPFSFPAFHAVEFGILIDITLLVLALADRVNLAQKKRREAQDVILRAQSVARAELENRVIERTRELSLLYELTAYVNEGLTMKEVLDKVYQSLRQVVPYERMGLALVEDEELEAVWSRQGDSAGAGIPAGYSVPLPGSRLETLLKSGQPRILSNLEEYLKEHPDSQSTAMLVKSGFRSSLTLPLKIHGESLGFLFLTCLRPNTYDETHVHFLTLIADQLSMIIEKSRMHDEQMRLKASLEAANEELSSLARIDPLTGLANRREFEAKLDQEWRRAIRDRIPISFIMLDIDLFKAYNDALGHLEGDRCLEKVAASLEGVVRRANDCATRYGGEEFGVLLSDCPQSAAEEIAESIRKTIESLKISHPASPMEVVTVSCGSATVIPELGIPPKELVQRADEALYQAKAGGRNRVVCARGDAA